MIKNVGLKSKFKVHWKVSPYDYSKDALKNIESILSKKYNISKDSIKIEPNFISLNEKGEEIPLTSSIIENIQEPKFQLELFKEYLKVNDIIEIRGIRIDKTARRVYIDGEEKNFTTKEFDLLTFLAENPNHVFTKEELFREIWDMDSVGDIATVTVHIKKIREKIEGGASKPQYIETIWGVGYRFKL